MAKPLTLINKDILQQYKLQNLIAPPEAEELTKVYDELQNILNKPRNEVYPNLDFYYKKLFTFMKLLHTLKFGTDNETPPPPPPPPPQEQQPAITPKPILIATKRRKRDEQEDLLPMIQTFVPKQPSPVPQDFSTPLQSPTSPTLPILSPKSPASPFKPTLNEWSEHFETILSDKTKNETPSVLELVDLIHKHVPDVAIISKSDPTKSDVVVDGRVYSSKQVVKILENLSTSNQFDLKNLDEDYGILFKHVLRPLIEKKAKPVLKHHLKGFNDFIAKEPRLQRSVQTTTDILNTTATQAPTVAKKIMPKKLGGTGLKKKNKPPLGKVHLKRWKKHLRSVAHVASKQTVSIMKTKGTKKWAFPRLWPRAFLL